MSKLQLPTVTLLIADCVNVKRAINVVEICKSKADFGDIKILSSIENDSPYWVKIPPLNTLVAYSIFMLTKSNEYFNTPHVLVCQRDGWILNPDSWNPEWLELDYIGPLFIQYDLVGSGGFSLRSKRLMEESARQIHDWDWTQERADIIQSTLGWYEDGILAMSNRFPGYKIATPYQASLFAAGGNPNLAYYQSKPFGFHGQINGIDHETGMVQPVCGHGTGDCECVKSHVNYLHKITE